MSLSLRQALRDSHISAVAIALLLFYSLQLVIQAFWYPFALLATFVFTAVAIHDVPYMSRTLDVADRYMLVNACFYLSCAITSFAGAWVLSRWIYQEGPVRSLSKYRGRLVRSNHV
jgi:hypothetical protein